MAYTLFISDLHLEQQRPEHLRALEALLAQHQDECEALYVLGDLFESWIGNDDDTPFHQQAIAAFRRFSDAGKQLYFMHGNRDFLLGDDFARACGGEMLAEGTVVDLYGTPTLLMHGDSLCTRDEKYMQFRAMVREPSWQTMMLEKPLQERRMIAEMMRMKSKQDNANKAENIMDVTDAEVVNEMEKHNVLHLIHGHTHRPKVHDVALATGSGKRWVLGDWGDYGWYIIAKPNAPFSLERFKIEP